MPTLTHGSADLRYEVVGDGPPVLALAPGGLRNSRIEAWDVAPWNPIEALRDRFTVVGMDQRNTGTSFAPLTAETSWSDYAADQLAVMDHLGIERFAVMGMCIGGAFILELIEQAPERIAAGVLFQPIGLDANRHEFRAIFEQWRDDLAAEHPEAGDDDWEACWSNLFGGDDLMWSVPDALLPTIDTPLLVLRGDDPYHPSIASERLVEAAPSATLVERWKEPADQAAARAAVEAFLVEHAT